MLGKSVCFVMRFWIFFYIFLSEYRILKSPNICIDIGLKNPLSVGLYLPHEMSMCGHTHTHRNTENSEIKSSWPRSVSFCEGTTTEADLFIPAGGRCTRTSQAHVTWSATKSTCHVYLGECSRTVLHIGCRRCTDTHGSLVVSSAVETDKEDFVEKKTD